MKKYKFTISGNQYDVHLKDIEDNVAELDVNGTIYEVEIHGEVKTSKTPKLIRKPVEKMPGEGQIKKSASTGKHKVTAPLPGTILKINVTVGDVVTEGQNLMVMEAMKMESEVKSPCDGKILAVHISAGDTVQASDPLFTIG